MKDLINSVNEMIFKEENILLPMLVDELTQDEWVTVKEESEEIGYIIDKVAEWKPRKQSEKLVKRS